MRISSPKYLTHVCLFTCLSLALFMLLPAQSFGQSEAVQNFPVVGTQVEIENAEDAASVSAEILAPVAL